MRGGLGGEQHRSSGTDFGRKGLEEEGQEEWEEEGKEEEEEEEEGDAEIGLPGKITLGF